MKEGGKEGGRTGKVINSCFTFWALGGLTGKSHEGEHY